MELCNLERFHVRKSDSTNQESKEEFGTEEKAKGRGVPVIHTSPADRGVTIVAFVGHFGVQGELFGEHVIGTPAESPGEVVAG